MELKKEKSTAKEVMSGKLESSYDIIRGKKKKMKKSIFKSLKKLLKKK